MENVYDKLVNVLLKNKFPYTDSLIHAFVGGSGLHGAQVKAGHDDDFFGIFIEPPNKVIGLHEYQHYVWSTSGDHERNVPGDVDICLYSLRKWARLASGGNPTALGYLFVPPERLLDLDSGGFIKRYSWLTVLQNRDLFISRTCVKSFEGFARHQLERITGERGLGKHGQRPELEEKFGYDVKAAMHVIRLLGEGIEILEHGNITYPRPNKGILIAIRSGKYELSFIKEMADVLFADLERAARESTLPDNVDTEKISDLLTKVYVDFWEDHGLI
jgi:predicted nucleotidyltransferase